MLFVKNALVCLTDLSKACIAEMSYSVADDFSFSNAIFHVIMPSVPCHTLSMFGKRRESLAQFPFHSCLVIGELPPRIEVGHNSLQ